MSCASPTAILQTGEPILPVATPMSRLAEMALARMMMMMMMMSSRCPPERLRQANQHNGRASASWSASVRHQALRLAGRLHHSYLLAQVGVKR